MLSDCRGKKILITGGAGFIGSHLVDKLSAHNEVVVLDNLSSGSLSNLRNSIGRITFVKGDILDAELLEDVVKGVGVIFHLAANVDVAESVANPVLCAMANIIGTINMLEVCKGLSIERFVYSSSAAVYGDTHYIVNEGRRPNPVSPYGISKLAAEQLCLMYYQAYGVPVVILRYFNVYGSRRSSDGYAGVIPKFLRLVKSGQPIVVYGDGNQTRDFIHVGDVVTANILAVTCPSAVGNFFNIGNGESISINQIIRILSQINGREHHVTYTDARIGEIRHSCADITKAQKVLGYKPRMGIVGGLLELWKDDAEWQI